MKFHWNWNLCVWSKNKYALPKSDPYIKNSWVSKKIYLLTMGAIFQKTIKDTLNFLPPHSTRATTNHLVHFDNRKKVLYCTHKGWTYRHFDFKRFSPPCLLKSFRIHKRSSWNRVLIYVDLSYHSHQMQNKVEFKRQN